MSTPIVQDEQMIAQYLFTKLPRSLSAAYKTLARLTYPIKDKQSLAVQLDALERPQEPAKTDVSAVDLIRGSFSVFDFPIDSPQSALEKFDGRVLEPRGGDLPPPDFGKGIDPAETYKSFGPLCSAFATQTYNESLRRGGSSFGAILAGQHDGQNCAENIGFTAGPCFDVALRAYFEARRSGSSDPQAWAAAHEAALRCSSFPVPHLPPPIPPSP
jgi:hypothetical protein